MKRLLFLLLIAANICVGQTVFVSDFPTGGTLTLSTNYLFNVNQTTAGQTVSVPSFSGGGKDPILVSNIGTVSFTLSPGGVISKGNAIQLDWNGSAWVVIGKGYLGQSYNSIITQTIANSDTSHAPSSDAVFDALALKQRIYSPSVISGTDIDWGVGGIRTKTLSANTTFTFSNVGINFTTITVSILNTASNYTVTWPETIDWGSAGAPTQRTGANEDVYTFIYNGTKVLGAVRQ